jgi:catechol 2,3-dioxygenase-like lactoylglutathione lyase family enzyme
MDRCVDRIVGLDGVRTDLAFMQTPDGRRLELIKFHSYRLCYVRGPEGIIVELAEQIG